MISCPVSASTHDVGAKYQLAPQGWAVALRQNEVECPEVKTLVENQCIQAIRLWTAKKQKVQKPATLNIFAYFCSFCPFCYPEFFTLNHINFKGVLTSG
jgi:hypothetical protein